MAIRSQKQSPTPQRASLPLKSLIHRASLTGACLIAAFGLSSCSPQSVQTNQATVTQANNSIPTPNEMKAEIRVAGRLSTLLQMDIRKLGRQIPYTYSAGKISNSPGYEWWVSKHFAIKSDLPECKVKLYLELLEMSYPHYVELFGAEPANIEHQRIAVVYGKSRVSTRNTMLDDGFLRGVHKNAGGETMYYNRAGYSFPSSREQHQRYIVIHETMHAFHMALSGHSSWAPNWITEGLADAIASHVYYPKRQQLAVMVRDRAPMSYLISGLKQFYAADEPSIAQINDNPALKRGLNFFIIHFLLSDPERAQYFAWFRDRLMAANPHSEATLPTANKLLKEVFPDWNKVEVAFQQYVKSQHSSFHIASGPWEQDGSAYWIRVQEEKQQPRLDIGITPRGQLLSDMTNAVDFPGPQANPLIIPPKDSQLGVLVDYQVGQLNRGRIGLGLGLELHSENKAYRKDYQVIKSADNAKGDKKKNQAKNQRPNYLLDSYFPLWIKEGRYLVFEGPDYQAFALTPKFYQALSQQNERGASLGINLTFGDTGINIELRTHLDGQVIAQSEELKLSPAALKRIKDQGISLLANSVSHRISPYLQYPENTSHTLHPDQELVVTNPWQFRKMAMLQRVFRACLQEKSDKLSQSCDQQLPQIYSNIADQSGHIDAERSLAELEATLLESDTSATLQYLSGLKNSLRYNKGKPQLLSEVSGKATLASNLNWQRKGQGVSQEIQLDIQSQGVSDLHSVKADKLHLQQTVNWRGKQFTVNKDFNNPGFNGVCMVDRNNLREDKLQNLIKISGPYSGKTHGKLRIDVMPSHAVKESVQSVDVEISPYETKSFKQYFDLNPGYQGPITIHSSATLEVDGEAIYLSQEQRIEAP